MADESMKRVMKGVDKIADGLSTRSKDPHDIAMAAKRKQADNIHRKLSGKGLNPELGWREQIDSAVEGARKRKTLSPENEALYRKQLGD